MPTSGTERRTCSLPFEKRRRVRGLDGPARHGPERLALDQAPVALTIIGRTATRFGRSAITASVIFVRQVARNVGVPETGRYPLWRRRSERGRSRERRPSRRASTQIRKRPEIDQESAEQTSVHRG